MKKIEKIFQFIKNQGVTNMQFEKNCGLSNGYLRNIFKTGSEISGKMLAKMFSAYPELESYLSKIENEARPVANDDFMMVPYLPASAQAGYALGFTDHTPPENIRTMLVPREYEKGLYMVIEIIGESMDDDTSRAIVSGDKLLIKELDRGSWVFRLPFKRSLFVIVTKDGVVCKQIIDHNLDQRTITCHSFNPSFEDFTLSLETDVLQLFVVKKIVEKQIRI